MNDDSNNDAKGKKKGGEHTREKVAVGACKASHVTAGMRGLGVTLASFQALEMMTKFVLVSESRDVLRLTPVEPGKKVPGFTIGKMNF